MPMGSRLEDEFAVAIGAFDEVLVAHLQIDARMAERAADPLALHAGIVDFDDFGGFDGHFLRFSGFGGRIIVAPGAPASIFAGTADRL